jgi:hypothetical protein
MNLFDLAQAVRKDCMNAPAGLPRVLFTPEEAVARTLLALEGLVRSRGLAAQDLADLADDLADDVRDQVFASRKVRFSVVVEDASDPARRWA